MRQLIRGRTLSFHADPVEVENAFTYHEDGAIITQDGKIVAIGDYAALHEPGLPEIDHRPHLILPGFIDTHIHFPQVQVIASWGAQLLDWLNTYTFPEESRFAQQGHAPLMAEKFLDLLLQHGTTTAVAFCSVHPQSAEALFSAAEARGMAMIAGKVMMDRNAPEAVLDTPQQGYDDSKRLIEKWHGRGRQRYAITPRFAITSTPEQMRMTGQLVREHPDCHIQTHLSENRDEIAFTLSLYPQARDYLDIYETYGLLSDKLLLGHSIHLEPREIARMAETGSRAVFCPTSNLFLGSGLFDEAGLRAAGVVSGIATDVGGGTSYSMLQTLNEGYKILQLRGQKLHPFAAFHWVTRGNALALGMAERIGTLDPGSDADLVVLDSRATPAMALRMDRAETLAEELFILQILGDDRAIAQTYVAGKPMLG
ncbi:guanine deaminase [Paracoccus denitrificans]|jgi:guanine deaminase|uniref:Guanine deaminase n=1 Tax=Paracoccus denitrificans (strain Pd 1222) TaxID=318586 RepID=A1B9Y0_PARDP|nr:guanine deaminase [Paracoccus denitrificans]ABL72324.1 guanine deaminase [Paracoccus denitrificans PD1222]MBB4629224.1 guanine deaminase [Paracoccus denitrificans]MCU7430244.1 guanine deaminase [Paracoccus denitrificans]QAR28889.1 guanine deaminase [Paracoccus denitrificans]UPV97041.1 guanine deaminase [Paracoccus denitrificans]